MEEITIQIGNSGKSSMMTCISHEKIFGKIISYKRNRVAGLNIDSFNVMPN